jgi:hypothetical protein|tara:strand:+ start:317 stop:508 length:192 start_codon:yes stop_codon:yes gene_type:complete
MQASLIATITFTSGTFEGKTSEDYHLYDVYDQYGIDHAPKVGQEIKGIFGSGYRVDKIDIVYK